MGGWDQALYKRALELDPHHVNILSNYGLFLSENGSYEGAQRMYETALAVDPMHSNCLYNYAVLFDSGFKVSNRALNQTTTRLIRAVN